ncbi:hypothetical protein MIC97_04380 [Aquamicrobium sp. NLF2-7]|uniref:hypothetical protein n=1 Tax=Aquamicrobium sp. NLF2-7 TaxID=2918753 RepID=UPI001EFA2E50|nr:hypothetical protein [Aquamicrobium sp. NLF2-7]MCG8270744.1 hypothetical protein [Aquamicrobium sp. NLF2-7]
MRIDGNTGPGTYAGREAVANVRSSSEQMGSAVQAARQTALSALTNVRFGEMLERLSDPRSSEALMLMSRNAGQASDASVFSSYAEFGD